MKIIEYHPWKFAFTCAGCKSELEAEAKDVKVESVGCFDEFETVYSVACTQCGTHAKVPHSRITPVVMHLAKRR